MGLQQAASVHTPEMLLIPNVGFFACLIEWVCCMNYLDLLLWVWAIFNGRAIFKGTE